MRESEAEQDLCKQVLTCDKNVRYAGIGDRFGKLVVSEYRKGILPLLSKEESTLSAILTSIRMGTRKTMQPKLGKTVFSFSLYEKVALASIPYTSSSFLMVSLDAEADHESIILKKIIPLIRKAASS